MKGVVALLYTIAFLHTCYANREITLKRLENWWWCLWHKEVDFHFWPNAFLASPLLHINLYLMCIVRAWYALTQILNHNFYATIYVIIHSIYYNYCQFPKGGSMEPMAPLDVHKIAPVYSILHFGGSRNCTIPTCSSTIASADFFIVEALAPIFLDWDILCPLDLLLVLRVSLIMLSN